MITAREIYDYLMDNYGECRHDEDAMAAAINDMVVDLEEQRVFKVPTEMEKQFNEVYNDVNNW